MSEALPPVAVIDASVLYSAPLRHLLLDLALAGAFQPRWTNAIQDEWTHAVKRARPDLDTKRIERTRQLMDSHFDDALVTGYEHLVAGLTLPDPDDRHVFAAAIHSGATVIVTVNLKDFPAKTLDAYNVAPQHPDDFVLNRIGDDKGLVLFAMRGHRARLKNPPETPAQYVAKLERHGLVKTAASLKSCMREL